MRYCVRLCQDARIHCGARRAAEEDGTWRRSWHGQGRQRRRRESWPRQWAVLMIADADRQPSKIIIHRMSLVVVIGVDFDVVACSGHPLSWTSH